MGSRSRSLGRRVVIRRDWALSLCWQDGHSQDELISDLEAGTHLDRRLSITFQIVAVELTQIRVKIAPAYI